MSNRLGYRAAKRALDLATSLTALLLLSPLLLVVALLVRLKLGSPVFFVQARAGLHGKPFRIFKFRTMTDARDAQGRLLPDGDRLPPFGQFLRSSSLDELPQLVQVVLGKMSLVGPRPLYLEYIPRYSPIQRRRLDVKPGITGWAQINGRNSVTWEERLAQDVHYVDHGSFWMDLRILALTVRKVIVREGISAANHATMMEFQGSDARHD